MKLKNIYKELFNEENYKKAYEEIKSNPGNMTDGETLDRMNIKWIKNTIIQMKNCSFQFKPSKRVFITKSNGTLRPLGIPSPRDKIIQKIILNVLEGHFEKIFLNTSYGFRPGTNCHKALIEVRSWRRTTWVIEGEIKSYFDNIDHHKLCNILKKYIDDSNFIDLYWKLVKAGYINFITNKDKFIIGEKGVPQCGILSPLLSNIYLHEFDIYMENIKKELNTPLETIYTEELNARRTVKRRYGKENLKKVRDMEKKSIPTITKGTEINYVRYADDFIIGLIGIRKQAEMIKLRIKEFLEKELLIELNMDKTHITNIIKNFTLFLGYYLGGTDSLRVKGKTSKTKSRVGYGNLYLYIPVMRLIEKLRDKGFVRKDIIQGKYYGPWINLDVKQIIMRYRSVLQGICNYYLLARNSYKLNTIRYLLIFSCAHTLAAKFKTSIAKIFAKYGKSMTIEVGNKMYDVKTIKVFLKAINLKQQDIM